MTKTNTTPRLLKVETGCLEETHKYFPTDDFVDYRVYDRVPRWWRWIEVLLRMDIYLALRTRRIADQYDIIWANSEKVAIPLSFLSIKKPLVVILQYPESPLRAMLIKWSGMARKWAGVGIVARDARNFLRSAFNVAPEKIFQYYAARTDIFQPLDSNDPLANGSVIFSMGVAKRDYDTLIAALAGLPGYHTDIYVSSKYGDQYKGGKINKTAEWIRFPDPVSDEELICRYQQSRFVVVPLMSTSHSGAGVTSIFEASASGKAVIATDTGGMSSYILDGETGLLVPPGDVTAMRNAIKKLWENPELAAQMGRNGRKFVHENYGYDMVVAGITSFLQNVWDESRNAES